MKKIDKSESGLRSKRTKIFYIATSLLAVIVILYMLFALRTLILPVLFGIIAAYICQPLLATMYRNGIPRWAATLILFGSFLITIFLLARYVMNLIPGEYEQLHLRASIQDNINNTYVSYMGLDLEKMEGNFVYSFVGPEINPLMDTFNQWLFLNEIQQKELREWVKKDYSLTYDDRQNKLEAVDSLLFKMNNRYLYTDPDILVSERITFSETEMEKKDNDDTEEESMLLGVLNILSLWLVMPVMFLFFLMDTGQMRRGFVSLIPNTYFEMVLTVMENVDRAIGNYLRGTLIEIVLMTLTLWILLVLIGFDIGIGMVLSLISGIANAIPIFGMFIGIGICVVYALILTDVSSVLPFINAENLIIWTVVAHLIAQGVDNAVFKPFILGKAVALHPIIVFLGAIIGSILFGFIGLLFAIPAIVILKEIFVTLYQQLKAYFIIY